jgi:hypothetical protein
LIASSKRNDRTDQKGNRRPHRVRQKKTIEQIRPKYIKGQKEHGGKLWEKNIVPLIREEVTDFNVYLPTLLKQVEDLVKVCDELLEFLPEGGRWKEPLAKALAPFHFTLEAGND